MSLILASKSKSRLKSLIDAGLNIGPAPSGMDENKIKSRMTENGAGAQEIAEELAVCKARIISASHKDSIVIGADQILVCEGKMFDKAKTHAQARENLKFLRAKTHYLITSVALVKNNETLWIYTAKPKLSMRAFSDAFLDQYMKVAGDALIHSVGGYFLESTGVTLFSKIDGDYHAILGMPLLELLGKLRELGIIDD